MCSRNSLCFASNDFTPAGVMSARVGVRHRIVELANVLVMAREGLIELELLRRRRDNILDGRVELCNVVVEAGMSC